MTTHDSRLTPARPDLAARSLQGVVDAPAYVDGTVKTCIQGKAWIRRAPRPDAPVETELLFGENFTVLDARDGFSWGQSGYDGYVGYIADAALGPSGPAPTHRVTASSSFLFSGPNLKAPVLQALPFNAKLTAGKGEYAALAGGGFVWSGHLAPFAAIAGDWVAVASRFIGVPYLWGGRTPLGFDCSGIVQSALEAAGIAAPRDTDMQEAALGARIEVGPNLQGLRRGDLIFWKGHVGLMLDAVRLLHANAHHMAVAVEPLAQAVARIADKGAGPVTSVKRLPG